MSIFSSYKKIFLLGFILVILIAIPFSVYVAQKRQTISTKATPSTSLSFEPAAATAKAGDTVSLNIMLDPGTGTLANQVSFVKLAIKLVDPAKFTIVSLEPNATGNTLNTKVEEPVYDNTAGKATISLSIGADPTKAIITKTKIAVLQLKANEATAPTAPNVTFDVSGSQVLSIDNNSQTSDNVLLSTAISATVTVTGSTAPTPTLTPIPTSIPTIIPTTPPSSSTSAAPICSSLEINGLANGTAPYALTFTAIGNDSDSAISKISFNFGDSIEDLTSGGGIGTSTVSGQLLHTYNTPGTYTAYAVLTDNSNNLSAQGSCTKTITIGSAPIQTIQPTQQPLPPTGDGKIMFGLGAIGVVFTIIGGALLILL
jgi:hypothetical protein